MSTVKFQNNPKRAMKSRKYRPVDADSAKHIAAQTEALKDSQIISFNRKRKEK